jgi:DNA invertase Pin-like site-specific DNA recombinase
MNDDTEIENITENPLDLFSLIKSQFASKEALEVDPTKLRYAMYVRKSTESEERQIQSIDDQIKDCMEFVVKPHKIVLDPHKDIYREEKSAKEAGTRRVFREVMEKIVDGKYDGLIAWHYDRISRNMKEAGEIIDLIDKGIIKDLKLAKATFENTPNGKMILGISFVLSKHYSDHLSESVLRGNKSSTQQGRILNHLIHGYRITEDRRLAADDSNYLIIEQAFRMRLEGKSQKDIASYINSRHYQAHRPSRGHYISVFDADAVSKLLRNPIYAGVLVYGDVVAKMADVDADFTPMISEHDFITLNGKDSFLPYSMSKANRIAPNMVSQFLRQFVICSECNRKMGTNVTVKKSKNEYKTETAFFRFRCLTKTCPNKGSGPQGSLVRNYAVKFLDEHLFVTKNNYERYRKDAELSIATKLAELKSDSKSLTVLVSNKRREYKDALRAAARDSDSPNKHYTDDYLDKLKADVGSYESQLSEVKTKIEDESGLLKTYDEYLELFANAADLLRSTYGMSLADNLIRIFFSNFTVKAELVPPNYKQKQWSVAGHTLNAPFDDFVKNGDFLTWLSIQD